MLGKRKASVFSAKASEIRSPQHLELNFASELSTTSSEIRSPQELGSESCIALTHVALTHVLEAAHLINSSHRHLLAMTTFMQNGYILDFLLLNVSPISVCAVVFWVSNVAFQDCSKQEKSNEGQEENALLTQGNAGFQPNLA